MKGVSKQVGVNPLNMRSPDQCETATFNNNANYAGDSLTVVGARNVFKQVAVWYFISLFHFFFFFSDFFLSFSVGDFGRTALETQ